MTHPKRRSPAPPTSWPRRWQDPENVADLRAFTQNTADIVVEATDPAEKTPYEPYYSYDLLNDINGSLCDYLSIDSIYKNYNIVDSYLDESSSIDIKEDIAKLYREMADTIKYYAYHNSYCKMSESMIEKILNGKVANLGVNFEDDIKLGIIWNYANSLFDIMHNNKTDINKATKYYELYLHSLPIYNPIQTSKKKLERNALTFLSHAYCYQKNFNQGFYYATKLYNEALADKDTTCIISAFSCLSNLYGNVSIEPERSLDYKLKFF